MKKNCKGKGKGNGNGKGQGQGQQGQGQGNDPSGGGTQPNDGEGNHVEVNGKKYDLSNQDEHDTSGELTPDQIKEMGDKIDRALREGGMLAGRMGAKVPRIISDLLTPKIDWREALREFVSSSMKGKDEYTWRKLNKRQLVNDIYLPSVEDETIGEVVVGIDTSGSIGTRELTAFATELASVCELCQPEQVRILWWDTQVHGEQIFKPDQYSNIASVLKPIGGGGTVVSAVSEYIIKNRIDAECVLMFTDGYLESDIVWRVTSPTLWMIVGNNEFEPPAGKKVVFDAND